MDAKQNKLITEQISDIPRIAPRPVAAAPSKRLHTLLAAGWMGFLWTIGLIPAMFAGPSEEEAALPALGIVDAVSLVMFLVTIVGIFVVISLATSNSKATAPASAACGLSVIIVGAMCGFAGHPAAAWGPNALLAAALVAGSLAIMGRRGAVAAS